MAGEGSLRQMALTSDRGQENKWLLLLDCRSLAGWMEEVEAKNTPSSITDKTWGLSFRAGPWEDFLLFIL